jgi:creatinine amidohydrolase
VSLPEDRPATAAAGQWREAIVLLPWGSCEAHGPHLPLSTDRCIAIEVCARAAARLSGAGRRVAVAPAVGLGVTEFAGSFEGTLSLRPATVEALVADLAGSLARHGARLLVLVNHHLEPAHFQALHAGARRATGESLPTLLCDHRQKRFALQLGDDFCRGGAHGGSYETSLMLAARPDLVDDAYRTLPDVPVNLGKRIREGAKSLLEVGGDRAYLGDPAQSTPALGELWLDRLAEVVVTTVEEYLSSANAGPTGAAP